MNNKITEESFDELIQNVKATPSEPKFILTKEMIDFYKKLAKKDQDENIYKLFLHD